MPLGNMRVLAMVTASGGLLACVGCGGSTKPSSGSTTVYTNGNTTATVDARAPAVSKQEIVKAQGCLKRERVRPTRDTRLTHEVPHGASELARNGLPMTPQEYEAIVRRCLARTISSSAGTRRK